MRYRNILTKQFLYQKYSIEKLSIREIAKIVGCSEATIFNYLKKFNIPIRTKSEANKGKIGYWRNKKLSENHKKSLSKSLKGKNNPMYGKHHTKETKQKISKAIQGENHPNYGKQGKNTSGWKGGKTKDSQGYIRIYKPEHPNANCDGYVREHRLVVEKTIGRYLLPTEVVHHINHIKDDNKIENLMGFINDPAHRRFHNNTNNVKPEEIIFDGRKNK